MPLRPHEVGKITTKHHKDCTALMNSTLTMPSDSTPILAAFCLGCKSVAYLKTAAAVPLRPREDKKAVMRQPGDSTALKCSMM